MEERREAHFGDDLLTGLESLGLLIVRLVARVRLGNARGPQRAG